MYYIYSSEHYRLPYWPEVTRLEFSRKFPNYFNEAIRIQLFRKLAEGLEATVTEVFDDVNGEIAFIPPFSALVLERSKKKTDIVDTILEVREEFGALRQGFAKLEKTRRSAGTLAERRRVRVEQRELLEAAASAYDRPRTLNLEGIIRYIPELIKPVTGPTDPSKYSANLLLQPVEWIVQWWRNRPISMLFDAAKQVGQIKEYEGLVKKHFGDRLDQGYY